MKATLGITFNESQLKEILNSLSIADCKQAMSFLQKRINQKEEQKRQKKEGIQKWDDQFLNTNVEEFDLHPRILNRLRENELNVVRDITELGIDKLTMFRGIGDNTLKEIKRQIFNNPS
jgi:DNA-directed RNA polymerase alpha subunit